MSPAALGPSLEAAGAAAPPGTSSAPSASAEAEAIGLTGKKSRQQPILSPKPAIRSATNMGSNPKRNNQHASKQS